MSVPSTIYMVKSGPWYRALNSRDQSFLDANSFGLVNDANVLGYVRAFNRRYQGMYTLKLIEGEVGELAVNCSRALLNFIGVRDALDGTNSAPIAKARDSLHYELHEALSQAKKAAVSFEDAALGDQPSLQAAE